MENPIIQLNKLSKYYGKHRGVIELDMVVNRGEIFGYLGPNGAGKTTTMRLLLDFMRPTSGSASIFGLDTRFDSIQIRKRTGYLSTSPVLYEDLTGREFLKYCSNLKGNQDWHYMYELVDRLQCDIDRSISTLSHGNKQKIAILRALMHLPELVIMDEPTTGLDPLIQHELETILRELADQGSTILFSSHVLSEAEALCDRVGIIREGKLIAVEDVIDLKSKQVRRLELVFKGTVSSESFTNIEGIKNVVIDGSQLSCEIVGSLDSFIKTASNFEVLDIHINEPSLEDIFLSYYDV